MVTEFATYKSYDACITSLRNLKAEEGEISKILEHEKAHFEKAKELGYNPLYGIWMVPDVPPVLIGGFVDFAGRVPKGKDMIEILLAPEHPGEHDLDLAERIRTGKA